MAISVKVKDVVLPRHLAAFPFIDRTSTDRVKMEVYTGWVGVNHTGGGSLQRTEAVTFVLLSKNLVQPYQQEKDLLEVTVTATPSSVADDDDEANVAAVDKASVKLEPQTFPGVGGSPLCLVLRATVAALNATVHAITYQVTVLTTGREDLDPIPLDPNIAPQ